MITQVPETFASVAERDAWIEIIKAECRAELREIEQYAASHGHYFAAMPVWIDGVWGDYWYCRLDGEDVGDMFYDGFGSVIKGTALGELSYKAARAAELKSERGE